MKEQFVSMSPLTWDVDRGAESVLVTARGKLDPASVGAFSIMLAGSDPQGAMLIDICNVPTAGLDTVHLLEAVLRRGAGCQDTAILVSGPVSGDSARGLGHGGARLPLIRCLANTRLALAFGEPTATDQPTLRTVVDELLPVAGAARHGRNVVTEACVKWDLPQLTGRATTVATELINYAADTAHTIMDLTVAEVDGALYVAVRHGPPVASSPGHVPRRDDYGFSLINVMTTHWGFLPAGDNTIVWARLFL